MIKSFYFLMVSLIVRQPELQPNKFSGGEKRRESMKTRTDGSRRLLMGDGNEKEREVLGG